MVRHNLQLEKDDMFFLIYMLQQFFKMSIYAVQ